MNRRRCPSCGYEAPTEDGPVHAYLTHSPECWARFNDAMTLHYSDLAYWPAHHWLVDAYTLQHSPGDDRRAIRSAAIHLAALSFRVENPDAPDRLVIGLRKALSKRADLPRFDPYPEASTTISVVSSEVGPEAHRSTVLAFADGVYADWHEHHPVARVLAAEALK